MGLVGLRHAVGAPASLTSGPHPTSQEGHTAGGLLTPVLLAVSPGHLVLPQIKLIQVHNQSHSS